MKRRTIILTESQLEEIANGINSAYLDSMGSTPDMPNDFANQISAQGSAGKDETYAKPEQTDDFKQMQTPEAGWPIGMKSFGKTAVNIREMSKKEWEDRYVFTEEQEHGNVALKNRKFGDNNAQYSSNAIKQKQYRQRIAAKKALNGSTPEEKMKGMQSLAKMNRNGGDSYKKAQQQYNTTKKASNLLKINQKMLPSLDTSNKTKNKGNGIITPSQE